jgi:hypothetical protein
MEPSIKDLEQRLIQLRCPEEQVKEQLLGTPCQDATLQVVNVRPKKKQQVLGEIPLVPTREELLFEICYDPNSNNNDSITNKEDRGIQVSPTTRTSSTQTSFSNDEENCCAPCLSCINFFGCF